MRPRPRQGLQLDQLLPNYSNCGRQHYAEVHALDKLETSHVGPSLGSPCPSCHRHAQQVVRSQHQVREACSGRQSSAEWHVSFSTILNRPRVNTPRRTWDSLPTACATCTNAPCTCLYDLPAYMDGTDTGGGKLKWGLQCQQHVSVRI